MRARAAAAAVCMLWVPACGTLPESSSPVLSADDALVLVSGDTGLPVAGASVVVSGRALRSDADGRVRPGAGATGALDVVAEHFLVRETALGDDRVVTLWPTGPAYTEDYVRHLLYKDAASTRGGPSTAPDSPLMRLESSTVSIVLPPELWADGEAYAAHERAIAVLNEATGGAVRFVLRSSDAGGVSFRAMVDEAAAGGGALTYRNLSHDAIVGGRIVYAGQPAARRERFVAHELGHVLGLQHSTRPGDLMYYQASPTAQAAFAPSEALTIRLLLLRRAGNRYPDNDRGGAGSAALRTSVVID